MTAIPEPRFFVKVASVKQGEFPLIKGYSLHDLFFCSQCHELRGPTDVSSEIQTMMCSSCSSHYGNREAQAARLRCVYCFFCPQCTAEKGSPRNSSHPAVLGVMHEGASKPTVYTRSLEIPVEWTSAHEFTLRCPVCGWDSKSIGLVAPTFDELLEAAKSQEMPAASPLFESLQNAAKILRYKQDLPRGLQAVSRFPSLTKIQQDNIARHRKDEGGLVWRKMHQNQLVGTSVEKLKQLDEFQQNLWKSVDSASEHSVKRAQLWKASGLEAIKALAEPKETPPVEGFDLKTWMDSRTDHAAFGHFLSEDQDIQSFLNPHTSTQCRIDSLEELYVPEDKQKRLTRTRLQASQWKKCAVCKKNLVRGGFSGPSGNYSARLYLPEITICRVIKRAYILLESKDKVDNEVQPSGNVEWDEIRRQRFPDVNLSRMDVYWAIVHFKNIRPDPIRIRLLTDQQTSDSPSDTCSLVTKDEATMMASSANVVEVSLEACDPTLAKFQKPKLGPVSVHLLSNESNQSVRQWLIDSRKPHLEDSLKKDLDDVLQKFNSGAAFILLQEGIQAAVALPLLVRPDQKPGQLAKFVLPAYMDLELGIAEKPGASIIAVYTIGMQTNSAITSKD